MAQATLWDQQTTIQERFLAFHEKHPSIYAEFKKIALDLLSRGRQHYSADAIMHVIRYHRIISGKDEQEPFKVNNSYISRYARMLIAEDARFETFFELRELRSE